MSSRTFNDVSQRLREELPHVRDDVSIIARETFPNIRFTNIWIQPGKSWFGDEIVDIWAVYDGEAADPIHARETLSFGTRVQNMLWDRGLDVVPSTHFVTKSDVGDWRPEGI